MKRKSIVMMAISLVMSIALGGCTPKKPEYPDNAPIFDSEGAVWYDSERATYELNISGSDYSATEVVGVTDDYLYVHERGVSYIESSSNNYEIVNADLLYKLTFDGEISSSLDISEFSRTEGQVSRYIEKVVMWDNQIYVVSKTIDYGNSFNSCTKLVPVNIESGTIGEAIYHESWGRYFTDTNVSVAQVFSCEDKLVIVLYDYENIVSVVYMNPDYTLIPVDISSELTANNVNSYLSSFMLDETTLIISTQNFYGDVFISVNLDDFSTCTVSDVEIPARRSKVPYDNCNVDRWEMSYLELIYSDENTYVYWGEVLNSYFTSQVTCVRLTLSENDLREGKGILTACCLGDTMLTPEQSRAIYEFNNTSDAYYIMVDDTFEASNFYDNSLSYSNQEEYVEYIDNKVNGEYALTNELAIALMNGNGPDIVFNGYEYAMLNNDDCLIDVSPFLERDVGENVYQIPTSIGLTGLVIKDNPVNGSQMGYDEYIRLVDEINNGYDPLNEEGRQSLFYRLLSSSGISLVQDNRANINKEEFRLLVDYCRDLLDAPECLDPGYQYPYTREDNIFMFYHATPMNLMLTCRSLNHDADSVLYGLPGCDGPVIEPYGTVAITAGCSSFNGAFMFVQTLLSTEVQLCVDIYSVPVDMEAFDLYCDKLIVQSEEYSDSVSYSLTRSDVDIYREALENAEYVNPIDPHIKIILWEEIQMYYANDRSFEDTVSVIENRIQTVLDERG